MPQSDWQQVTFEKGLNTTYRPGSLEDGQTQELLNFQLLPNGGITPRAAWLAAGQNPTGTPVAPSEPRLRGIFTRYHDSAGQRKLILTSYDTGAPRKFVTYQTNSGDPTQFTAYTQIDAPLMPVAAYDAYSMAYATGNNVLLMSSPGLAYPNKRIRYWDGAVAGDVNTDTIAGRTLIYHLNRFWTGGSLNEPTYLRYSEIGSYSNWNTSENFIPVGQDDGQPIEDIIIWDRGLLIGKTRSLHFLSGNTIDNFNLAPVDERVGVAVGRSMVATPNGVYFVSPQGMVYLYDGASVDLVSGDVDLVPSASTDLTDACSITWIQDTLYVALAQDSLWAFDGSRWRREEVSDTEYWPEMVASVDNKWLLMGSDPGVRFLNLRSETGAFDASAGLRSPLADITEDGISGTTYTATTKEWWPRGPVGKTTLRSVYVRYHQWSQFGGGDTARIEVTPVIGGIAQTSAMKEIGGNSSPGPYQARVDFAEPLSGGGFALKFEVVASQTDPTYAIDEVYLKIVVDGGAR